MKTLQPGKKVKGYGDFQEVFWTEKILSHHLCYPRPLSCTYRNFGFQAGKDVYVKNTSYDC